jgi:hypothetical protein
MQLLLGQRSCLAPTTKQQGAGKLWLSYAGINRGQVQRVFLSLPLAMQHMEQESTPSLYGCADKLKDNARDCKLTTIIQKFTVVDYVL